ncbi:conjugal transfer ATP-binding protein TraC [Brevibacillus sp. IT-7CA2]|uniref:VirB4 family type IV secretion system protein n=1 Tax=Brevibacillus sp. IT-7CA2 TaxID=3026436 RepID=UPI0039E013AE
MFWRKGKPELPPEEKTQSVLSEKESTVMSPSVLIDRQSDAYSDYRVEIGNNTTGAKFVRTWFAKMTGRTTWVGMLDRLLLQSGEAEIDLTVAIEPIDGSTEMNRMADRIALLQADMQNTHHRAKLGSMYQELSDLEQQMARLRTNEEKLFNTSFIVSIGSNKPEILQKMSRLMVKAMGSIGMLFKAADTRQLQALRHAIGIGKRSDFDDTYMQMESSNVADSFPFGYGGLSHRTGIVLGLDHYNRPVYYDNWHPPLANQNGLIFGRSGAGKSFAFKIITRRTWSLGVPTGIVDLHREYKDLVDSMDGVYIELSPTEANHHRINLYEVREETDKAGRTFVNLEESHKAILPFLFKIVRLLDKNELTGQVKVALYDTLQALYEDWKITTDPQSLFVTKDGEQYRKSMPTLYDHYQLMKDHKDLQRVLPFFRMFTREGGDPSKSIFDGESTFDVTEFKPIGICLEGLDKEWMQPLGMFVSMKWLYENFVKKNRRRKRLFIDEAQKVLENEEDAIALENQYREIRKLNGGIWIATQGFEVLLRVPQGMGILKNAPTKLLMRQEAIDIDAVQGKFDLSEGEAMRLLNAPKGVGILKVDEESTIVRILSTPEEYWRYTTDMNDLEGVS